MNTSKLKNLVRPAAPSRPVMTLDFRHLRVGDLVVIRTQNNLYRFTVTDAEARRGRLRGEWRKCHFPDAVLVGALIEVGEQLQTLNGGLQTLTRAIFLVQQGGESHRLITSAILAIGWFIDREA